MSRRHLIAVPAAALALSLTGLAAVALAVGPAAPAAAAEPAPGTYAGPGFDTCDAPSNAAMQAWQASPYRAVGVYLGGINRACPGQPNLTPAWVSARQAAGWHLLPIYLGLQAPCTTSNKEHLIDPPNAAAQGRAEAGDAVARAIALGLGRGSAIFGDMEAYRTDDAGCRTAVLTYQSAWTARLHALGYFSGFYSSLGSGVADQVAVYGSGAYVRPDYLWFARYDGVPGLTNPAIPSSYWTPHRRIKQYTNSHNETHGGVTINIDNDQVDVAPPPATPFGDLTGNGWSDLVARQVSTGELYRYPGNGTSLDPRTRIGTSWQGMTALTRLGDFNRDGPEDVVARDGVGGLWLYRGTAGGGLGTRTRIGTGWNTMREITAAGDADGDGFADLLAVQASTGVLYRYPGRGASLGARVRIGGGWNAMDELTGVGDFTRDGFADLLVRERATGYLWLYRGGAGGGLGNRTRIGTGWNTMRDLTGVGDFDRDGYTDLIAIERSTGALYRYPGRATTLSTRIRIGTSWTGMQPLL